MKLGKMIRIFCLLSGILFFIAGCEPKTEITIRPEPERTITYKSVMETQKGLRFDHVSEGKVKEENTKTKNEIVYEQTFTGFDQQGNSVVDINIISLVLLVETLDGIQTDFDSKRQEDFNEPLSNLIGLGYTIAIDPNGQVASISNVGQAKEAVKSQPDKRIAASLLSDEAIRKRHSIDAFPNKDKSEIKESDQWTRIESPQVGMLLPVTFEKIYTVKNITSTGTGKIATIEISSLPSVSQSDGSEDNIPADLGAFTKMFDSKQILDGELVYNINTGKVIKYSEVLTSTNTAAELPRRAKKDQEPDVLKLSFSWMHSIEALD